MSATRLDSSIITCTKGEKSKKRVLEKKRVFAAEEMERPRRATAGQNPRYAAYDTGSNPFQHQVGSGEAPSTQLTTVHDGSASGDSHEDGHDDLEGPVHEGASQEDITATSTSAAAPVEPPEEAGAPPTSRGRGRPRATGRSRVSTNATTNATTDATTNATANANTPSAAPYTPALPAHMKGFVLQETKGHPNLSAGAVSSFSVPITLLSRDEVIKAGLQEALKEVTMIGKNLELQLTQSQGVPLQSFGELLSYSLDKFGSVIKDHCAISFAEQAEVPLGAVLIKRVLMFAAQNALYNVNSSAGDRRRAFGTVEILRQLRVHEERVFPRHVPTQFPKGACIVCCSLCPTHEKLINGKPRTARKGRTTVHGCAFCAVLLCRKARRGQQLSCWEVWHSVMDLPGHDRARLPRASAGQGGNDGNRDDRDDGDDGDEDIDEEEDDVIEDGRHGAASTSGVPSGLGLSASARKRRKVSNPVVNYHGTGVRLELNDVATPSQPAGRAQQSSFTGASAQV